MKHPITLSLLAIVILVTGIAVGKWAGKYANTRYVVSGKFCP